MSTVEERIPDRQPVFEKTIKVVSSASELAYLLTSNRRPSSNRMHDALSDFNETLTEARKELLAGGLPEARLEELTKILDNAASIEVQSALEGAIRRFENCDMRYFDDDLFGEFAAARKDAARITEGFTNAVPLQIGRHINEGTFGEETRRVFHTPRSDK